MKTSCSKVIRACLWGIFLSWMVLACNGPKMFYSLPTFVSEGTFNAVIEIPAGTNKKIEYDEKGKIFRVDEQNGKERVIDFLPYPANYGFIPSTLSDTLTGGDGDALDVLVLAEALETGTVIECIPVGVLKLMDDGEEDYKIIAIPLKNKKRVIDAQNFAQLSKNYPAIMEIIELWFLNYNKDDLAKVKGWGDEKEALKDIQSQLKD
ncbi:MAG: inorganic diphosphatase [Flavobacteriaceae bacterium]|uniref:inorganic diphosphatase n=1 Tax=Flagellimonas TaxID=444459 RepID=UPI003BABF79D|nr:inorganic diphosphatase [Flavobacteriaceae bacterium]